jgi:Leucine-rich repeat (LRR) protein
MHIRSLFRPFLSVTLLTLSLSTPARAAEFVSVCDRLAPIRDFLTQTLKKPCDAISEEDLSVVKRIAVPNRKITSIRVSDLANLSALEILNIKRNLLTELPEGLLPQLPSLKVLVILGNKITHLPDSFLEGNPLIEKIHIFGNPYRTISESIFVRLAAAEHLNFVDVDRNLLPAEKARLADLFPKGHRVVVNYN